MASKECFIAKEASVSLQEAINRDQNHLFLWPSWSASRGTFHPITSLPVLQLSWTQEENEELLTLGLKREKIMLRHSCNHQTISEFMNKEDEDFQFLVKELKSIIRRANKTEDSATEGHGSAIGPERIGGKKPTDPVIPEPFQLILTCP